MHLSPKSAHAALAQVDPGRMYKGYPVGCRDGAVLALLAAGFSAAEISRLPGTHITKAGTRIVITVRRRGVYLSSRLPVALGLPVAAWMTERRLWSTGTPAFAGPLGPLSPRGVCKILERYCGKRYRRSR
jgi:hypothetical protein